MTADARQTGARDYGRFWLTGILILAAALRLIGLGSLPPALSADEASNAYDGYCLLETQADRWGESWPIVLRAFGDADYRPALLAWLTVPFQALLGPDRIVTAARLPAALCGVLTVWLLYSLASRLFSRPAGLWAALFLALSPWHIVISRLAHESALTPILPVLILWLLCRSRLLPSSKPPDTMGGMGKRQLAREPRATPSTASPPSQPSTAAPNVAPPSVAPVSNRCIDQPPDRALWPWGLAAGIAIGLSPYTYAAAKLFVPALLLGLIIVYRHALFRAVQSNAGRLTFGLTVLVALIVAGPMLWLTFTDWDQINARALTESLFHTEPIVGQALITTLRQYAAHFGPKWLFITGHPYVDQSPAGYGQLHWYLLPPLLIGLAVMVGRVMRSRAALLILLWLLLYPIASATTQGGVNAARAACGLAVFPLIAGVGLAWVQSLLQSRRKLSFGLSAVASVIFLLLGGRFARCYFVDYPRNPEVQARYLLEFRQAMDYLRPRQNVFDHVFVTDRRSMSRLWHTSEAYIFPAVYLPIPPADFHAVLPTKIELSPPDRVEFHYIARLGDFTFTISDDALAEYRAVFPTGRILLIARPGEVVGGKTVHRIHRTQPDGRAEPEPCLVLIAADLSHETPRVVAP